MANRKKYFALDDVGFLGVAKERSAVEIRKDAKRTSDFIKKYQATANAKNTVDAPSKGMIAAGYSKGAVSSVKRSTIKTK